jgi:hypothetical protein
LVSIDTLAGGEALTQASAQLLEPHCGLVAYALLLDRERGSFVSADHLTDRHFAVALGAERR